MDIKYFVDYILTLVALNIILYIQLAEQNIFLENNNKWVVLYSLLLSW